jgi:tetratricopeptide (TPR) repeat protein
MKQTGLTIVIALIAMIGVAQNGNVTNAASAYNDYRSNLANGNKEQATKKLLEAKTYIDMAMEHPETKDNPKALMYKGKIYFELAGIVATSEDETAFGNIDPEKISEEGLNALTRSKAVDEKKRYVDDVNQYANIYRVQLANLGITAYGEGKWEIAMSGLLGAVKFGDVVGVKDSMYYFYGGMAAYQLSEWDAAAEAFGACVELEYNTAEAVSYQSRSLVELGRKEEAEKALQSVVEKHPNDVDILIQQANFYIDAGRLAEAEKALSAAIALAPDNVALLFTLGNIYYQMGRRDEAEAAYRGTLELDPNNVNANFSLGVLFYNKGADMNNEANKLPFGDPNYDKLIGESNEMFKKALPFLEQASAAEPNDVNIVQSLNAVYGKLGMTEKYNETKARINTLNNQ